MTDPKKSFLRSLHGIPEEQRDENWSGKDSELLAKAREIYGDPTEPVRKAARKRGMRILG